MNKLVIAGCFGTVIFILGIIFVPCFPLIYRQFLHKDMSIEDGTQGYKAWQNIPLPIYLNFYFFNLTNAVDFMENGSKPNLEERGPYVYRSWWVRKNIQWFTNGTVSSRQVKKYIFMPNMSVGQDDEFITTLNVPLITLGTWVQKYPNILKQFASDLLERWFHEELFIHKPVKNLVFDGYPDVIALLEPLIIKDMPASHGKFGFFIGRNNTDDGEFLVYTGKDDISQLNVISRWKGHRTLHYWDGPCNDLNGSTADLNPPPNKYGKSYIFDSDLCRSWGLDFTEELTHMGVPVYRFVANISILENSTTNEENACFATERNVPNGAMDISPCQFGAPILLSFPHFYLADPAYSSGINGMRPNASLHSFHVDIEPHSGLSLDFAARVQASVALEKVSHFKQLENVPEIVIPIFWQEVRVTLTDSIARELKSRILNPLYYGKIIIYILTAFGAFICIVCAILAFLAKRKRNKDSGGDTETLDGSVQNGD